MKKHGILRGGWFLPGVDIVPPFIHDPLGLVVRGNVVGKGLHPSQEMCPERFELPVIPMPDVGDGSVWWVRAGEGDLGVHHHTCVVAR